MESWVGLWSQSCIYFKLDRLAAKPGADEVGLSGWKWPCRLDGRWTRTEMIYSLRKRLTTQHFLLSQQEIQKFSQISTFLYYHYFPPHKKKSTHADLSEYAPTNYWELKKSIREKKKTSLVQISRCFSFWIKTEPRKNYHSEAASRRFSLFAGPHKDSDHSPAARSSGK